MALLKSDFEMGQIVYLKTDPEQLERMVVAVMFCVSGGKEYRLSFGTEYQWHYGTEISTEPDQLKKLK